MDGAWDPLHVRTAFARTTALIGSAVVRRQLPAHCLLQVVKRSSELCVAGGAND